MTKKRFELAYEKDNWWAVRDGDITLWKEEVIYLLNELAEENQQLRELLEYGLEVSQVEIDEELRRRKND